MRVWGVCEHLSGLSAGAARDVDGRQALRHRGQSSSAEQDDAVFTLRAEGERDLWAYVKRHRFQLHVPGPGEAHSVQVLTERESQSLIWSFNKNPPVAHQLMASDWSWVFLQLCQLSWKLCIMPSFFFFFYTFQMALCTASKSWSPGQNCVVETNKQTNKKFCVKVCHIFTSK